MRSTARPVWMNQAACLDEDPDLFHPASQAPDAADPAKRICHGCPVRLECLEFALETGQGQGVWGGLDEEERRSLVRQCARREAARREQTLETTTA